MTNRYDRRAFMGWFASVGLGSTLLPGVLWARVADGAEITAETVACAEEIAGLSFEADEREMMVKELRSQAEQIATLHSIPLPNDVPLALSFDPLGVAGIDVDIPAASATAGTAARPAPRRGPAPTRPADIE